MDLGKPGSSSEQTTKRSYECTFCKRGFTNAQALGGHMNIHRKDRAKAKLLSTARPSISSNYYPARFQAPGPSPSPSLHPQYGLRMNEELWGANLSLGIGPAEMEGSGLMKMRCMRKEAEIDLELRLGH